MACGKVWVLLFILGLLVLVLQGPDGPDGAVQDI